MPEWLPEILVVIPWGAQTYEMLYRVFCLDIRDTQLRYEERDVWFFKEQVEDGKEKLFWHLTDRKPEPERIPRRKQKFYPPGQTHTKDESDRLPDMRRCERLNWVKPLIEHPSDPDVLAWDYEEGNGDITTYVWIKKHRFLVLMKKMRNGSHRLLTSFYVDEHRIKGFQRKYESRM